MVRLIAFRVPTPGCPHDCGDELRYAERHGQWGNGTQVQCSCGRYYALRQVPFWMFLLGPGRSNHKSRYFPLHYWAFTGQPQ